jgi:hypothetical protein
VGVNVVIVIIGVTGKLSSLFFLEPSENPNGLNGESFKLTE